MRRTVLSAIVSAGLASLAAPAMAQGVQPATGSIADAATQAIIQKCLAAGLIQLDQILKMTNDQLLAVLDTCNKQLQAAAPARSPAPASAAPAASAPSRASWAGSSGGQSSGTGGGSSSSGGWSGSGSSNPGSGSGPSNPPPLTNPPPAVRPLTDLDKAAIAASNLKAGESVEKRVNTVTPGGEKDTTVITATKNADGSVTIQQSTSFVSADGKSAGGSATAPVVVPLADIEAKKKANPNADTSLFTAAAKNANAGAAKLTAAKTAPGTPTPANGNKAAADAKIATLKAQLANGKLTPVQAQAVTANIKALEASKAQTGIPPSNDKAGPLTGSKVANKDKATVGVPNKVAISPSLAAKLKASEVLNPNKTTKASGSTATPGQLGAGGKTKAAGGGGSAGSKANGKAALPKKESGTSAGASSKATSG